MRMFHIGKCPPSPKPSKYGGNWNRLKRNGDVKVVSSGVFVTPCWQEVWKNHGIRGHVYILDIPMSVIVSAGGITYYDHAHELLIPEAEWREVKLLGKIDRAEASRTCFITTNPIPRGGSWDPIKFLDRPHDRVIQSIKLLSTKEKGVLRQRLSDFLEIKWSVRTGVSLVALRTIKEYAKEILDLL